MLRKKCIWSTTILLNRATKDQKSENFEIAIRMITARYEVQTRKEFVIPFHKGFYEKICNFFSFFNENFF